MDIHSLGMGKVREDYVLIKDSDNEPTQLLSLEKRKAGRPFKAKAEPKANTPSTSLKCFLNECFEISDSSDDKVRVVYVRARHRFWRDSFVNKMETSNLDAWFKERFDILKEDDPEHDLKSGFYTGLKMKPWAPVIFDKARVRKDVTTFLLEKCEIHIMGRAAQNDLLKEYTEWKQKDQLTVDQKKLFLSHLNNMFIFHQGVPIVSGDSGVPGFYGLYLKSATEECRIVGYKRSQILTKPSLSNLIQYT